MIWANANDVKDRWISDDILPEDNKINLFIQNVENQIKNRFPNIEERVSEGIPTADFMKDTICQIVIEYLITGGNPYASESQSISGVAARSVSFSSSKARTSLRLTEDDMRQFSVKTQKGMNVNIAPSEKNGCWHRCVPHSSKYSYLEVNDTVDYREGDGID